MSARRKWGGDALANPDWDAFVAGQPALAGTLRPFLRESLAEGALAVAQKELIVTTLLAAQGYEAGVRSHAGRALAAGATSDQLREALGLLIAFAGIGRYLHARGWIEAAIAEAPGAMLACPSTETTACDDT